jgi:hypothetical protein
MNEEHVPEITRFAIVGERLEKKVKEEQVSRIILSESVVVQDHNANKVKDKHVP